MAVRWIRLDVTWSGSEWLEELPPASRLAWVELLCYVKAFGVAGSVKKPSPAHLSRIWNLSKSSVEVMLAAASHDSAIVFDGPDLLVTGWSSRQSDPKSAARVRAYRERQKGESPDPEPPTVTEVTRYKRNTDSRARTRDTHRDRDRSKTKTPTEKPSSLEVPPSTEPAREDDDDLELEIKKYLGTARKNVIAIHGGTEMPVQIEGHEVGVGIEIDAFKGLCRAGHDPPEIIAAAIAYIPIVSDLEPPVSLARWGAKDGRPIYEQCVGRAYQEVTQ